MDSITLDSLDDLIDDSLLEGELKSSKSNNDEALETSEEIETDENEEISDDADISLNQENNEDEELSDEKGNRLNEKSSEVIESEIKDEYADKMASIKKVFDAANDNVKSATLIFNKCVDLKDKLDKEKQELVELKKKHMEECKKEKAKVDKHKEDVFNTIKEKKAEVDLLIEDVKKRELELSNAKERLDLDKKKSYEKIRQKEEKLKQEYDEKKKKIDEEKQKIIEERKKLDFEKEKADKTAQELEQNLVKFNDVVKQFTSGIDGLI